MRYVEAVILDWAGTTVDYGCFAPVGAFMKVFEARGVPVRLEEARAPMGLQKRDHIGAMAGMERIREEWRRVHGREPLEGELDAMYEDFRRHLLAVLTEYAAPIPGAVDTVAALRAEGLRIGSTTGYTAEMMNVLVPEARDRGYAPDVVITPDDVPAGRPWPWMCYVNAMRLGVFPLERLVKVGDTLADVQEGRNAGMWSVAVVEGSSELGLSLDEVASMPSAELAARSEKVRASFESAGAHLVLPNIALLPEAVEAVDLLLAKGGLPQATGTIPLFGGRK
ncbi:phosphonoacetaldehyde hydrolase [Aminiphilus sp.]|uniref:phosphonoacetaldehyde hydrolase n=1 Tax=Aminiphilus sp. TaxID=1872488 RepID=UPI00261464A3|nr:phosphonoacetaldehyde hydrolase [Aminiphilus sp.]